MDKLGNLLPKVLARQPGRGRVIELRVKMAFAALLGPDLTSSCESIEVRAGTLIVATSNPALAHQLRLDSEELLTNLNAQGLGRRLKVMRVRTGRSATTRTPG